MEKALSIFGILAYLALAFRLWQIGLWKSYRWLFTYCLVAATRIAGTRLLFTKFSTDNYFHWWAGTEVTIWMLFVLMVLELHGQIFQQYPGLASFGRRLFKVSLAISIPLSIISVLPETGTLRAESTIMTTVIVLQRSIVTSLLLFLIILLASMLSLLVRLKRNAIVHAVVFFLYFLAKAGLSLVFQSLGVQMKEQISIALMTVTILCVIAWIFGLTTAGESVEVRVGHQWSPDKGERLVEQLSAINSALSRSTRK